MIYLKENMRYLRKQNGMTQGDLADKLDIKRSHIGSYEEGRGVPKLSVIKQMADLFEISVDQLLASDLSNAQPEANSYQPSATQPGMKLLSIVVTPDNEERIAIVPVKASAGYLTGRADREYMEQLPNFSMPVAELNKGKTYRVFQIKGDSMLPVPPGSYIFCDYVESISGIREGKPYVVITADEGVVYKRVYLPNEKQLLLKSDNPEYEPYTVEQSSVFEIWKAIGFLSFELPEPDAINIQKLGSLVAQLQGEIIKLKG
ncbi:MAG TPA: LexA family transcriptional regulator [Prolixibacteraceae bacterium]|nr:LexA family transcriptional regulator [Prolixibacteraceae bacterium]